ncbi:MAG: DJ-1/PfpI family protein [Clostridiales bacterium]|jgi:4-methyl-5(b-hydroxyethyl)-thiazole monophosphate biosynthesis|nr:DJ-1/PfpI family protein [Clostridiales bacterium]
MMNAAVFFVNGFEETEAVTPIDVLRRGNIDVTLVSLEENSLVTGSHGITLVTEKMFSDIASKDFDMLILPGGPGTALYKEHPQFLEYLTAHYKEGKKIAAICAAPSVFGMLGFLEGRRAVCYAGYEPELKGSVIGENPVETDGNVITSRSAATALLFGFALLEALAGKDAADKVRGDLLVE